MDPQKALDKKFITRLLTLLICSVLGYMTITGADCEQLLGTGFTDTNLYADWQLQRQTGAQQDICIGEILELESNGQATLTCPGSSAITRNFTVSNTVLTYTSTNVQYNIDSLTTTRLVLSGVNVNRVLSYNRIITAVKNDRSLNFIDKRNSSD